MTATSLEEEFKSKSYVINPPQDYEEAWYSVKEGECYVFDDDYCLDGGRLDVGFRETGDGRRPFEAKSITILNVNRVTGIEFVAVDGNGVTWTETHTPDSIASSAAEAAAFIEWFGEDEGEIRPPTARPGYGWKKVSG